MSTTRHHINRRRRLATVATAPRPSTTRPRPRPAEQEAPAAEARTAEPEDPTAETETPTAEAKTPTAKPKAPTAKEKAPTEEKKSAPSRADRRPLRLLVSLVVLTLLLGAFAGWAFAKAGALADAPAARNTALTDAARTSEIKGQAGKAVNALFSYDHANPEAQQKAAKTLLTGKAVAQHRDLLAPVLAQAEKQKTVVTTAVTDSAVERIDGDRARVLVFADQSSTSTAAKAKDDAAYAGAMLAVDLVHEDGRWLVSAIDTFTD